MHTTYIQHLAADLLRRFGKDLSRVAVVFPNKRASLFLNEELARQASSMPSSDRGIDTVSSGEQETSPLWSPAYITISDLFRRHSDLHVADQILLVCRLYDVYCRVTGFTNETLDHFYNWGLLLLADFDDLDKNMGDAEKIFQTITDHHELDSIDYLNPEQLEALKHFFGNFNDNHESKMKEKFMRLWSKLYDIYSTFREELRDDHLAYEGMLYRDVIEQDNISFEYDTYCFVGFNMLQKVEQQLFTRLKMMDRALFYWDYDTYYLNNHHEAGHFIMEYLSRFPDALEGISHTNFLQPATSNQQLPPQDIEEVSITYISAPTENLQARYVHDWLLENDRWKAGARTAIVMSDERLLQTIICSLPSEVTKVNITTGYPLSQSPVVSFLQQLIELQTSGHITGTDKYRLRYVSNVLGHPYAKYVTPATSDLYQHLRKDKIFYPSRTELSANDEALAMLFVDLDTMTLNGYDTLSQNVRLILWLQNIIKKIAVDNTLDALAKESIFRTYQVLQRLFSLSVDGTLAVDISTFRRLLMQVINTTTVPYHGEPIEGIQIMGVLETRCLDFEHILLLSCNEGNLPKSVNDSSFIPHSIRQAYDLTTVENKVAIFSYYFHRLLQRSDDITITYNSSTEGTNTGEMSRFMLQLMVETNNDKNIDIRRISLQTGQDTTTFSPRPVIKNETIQARLNEILVHTISPSSLGKYLRCQLLYYYMYVARLKDNSDEDPDEIDNAVFGTVFHKACENLYDVIKDAKGDVHADAIKRIQGDDKIIMKCLDDAFATEVFNLDSTHTYRPEYNGLQLINRDVMLRLLKDLLNYDRKRTPFRILGQEIKVLTTIKVNVQGKEHNVRIGGDIDRLDMSRDKDGYRINVIDYKTGSKEQRALNSMDEIFVSANISKHADYFLQAMLYSHIVRYSAEINAQNLPVAPHLFFVQKLRQEKYNSLLVIDKTPILDINDVDTEFINNLSRMIAEIHNPDIPFHPAEDSKTCKFCSFKSLCGM